MEKSIQNFTFQNPTKILFGKKRIEEIDNEIPKDAKVLILYGGGSVKKMELLTEQFRLLEGAIGMSFRE